MALFQIFTLIFSVIIHEISHGFTALAFGDKTAEYEGRLTLNPIPHLDLWGSVIIPFSLFFLGAPFMIGWAKPVPYNPYNLKHRRIAEPLVALAGPTSNLFVACVFGAIIRGLFYFGMSASPLVDLFSMVVLMNIALAIFNLVPIPPLDGSKILFSFLPIGGRFAFSEFAQKYGIILIIAMMFFLSDLLTPVIFTLFSLITSIHM